MSCTNNTSNINKTFIIEPQSVTGDTPTLTACTAIYTNEVVSCSGDTTISLTDGATIFNTDIVPLDDDNISLGQIGKRFRNINSISGSTSVWVATTRIETPEIRLGIDSSGNTRTITANNSIIQDDCLFGGTY